MSVVVSVDEVGPCKSQVTIEVPQPAVAAETDRVVQEFRRQARLPGFRKGKVPEHLVRQRYEEEIRQELLDRLVPRYWRQAQAEKELEPLLPPSVESVDLELGAKLRFVATVETRPEVELDGLDEFELPEHPVEPTDEEVELALEDVQRELSEWRVVERGAARGDLVVGEIQELSAEEGEIGEQQSVSFEVGDPNVWEELTLAVTGKTAGQTSELSLRRENEAERHFRVRVDEVKERELPELNDALAARAGKFETLSELRQAVRARLQAGKQAERQMRRESALLDQMRDRFSITLPAGLVDQEIEGLLTEYAQSLAGQGVDLESSPPNWQELAEQVRPQAEKRVHARLLLDEAAAKLDVEIASDELEATIAALARSQGKTSAALRQSLDRAGRLPMLKAQMKRDRVVRRLTGAESLEAAGAGEAASDEHAE